MSKKFGDFLSLDRLKNLGAYLVCREVVTRLHGSTERYNKNIQWDISKLPYKFKEPITKHLNYILDSASFCPSAIQYGGGFHLSYNVKIDNSERTLIIDGLVVRKKLNGVIDVVSSFGPKKYPLVSCGNKSLGLESSVFDDMTNELARDFIRKCEADRDTIALLCYYHILNSISKKTKINEPIGYITGAFVNNMLTRILIRSEKKELKYDGDGVYTVYNKIKFTICGKPEEVDFCYDFIEETTKDSKKINYEIPGEHHLGLRYISDQAELIKNGLQKILGLSY